MVNLIIVPTTPSSGVLRQIWIDTLSVTHDISRDSNPNVFVTSGAKGLGGSTLEVNADKKPFSPGTFIRHINTKERTWELPLFVRATSFSGLLSQVDDLHDWFATGDETHKTAGIFKVVRPDDTVRQVSSYCTEGLDSPEEEGVNWARYVLKMYSPDPYPNEGTDTVNLYTVAQAASIAVLNQGRLEAYPIWKITGPFTTSITITNNSVSPAQVITLNLSLTAGHYLIIDTRPSDIRPGFSVYDDLAANRINTVTPTSIFWSMPIGLNAIVVAFGGGTTVATTVQLTYLARYRSLYK